MSRLIGYSACSPPPYWQSSKSLSACFGNGLAPAPQSPHIPAHPRVRMSPLNGTEHGDPHRARTKLGSFAIGLVHGVGGSAGVGILLVASIEWQLLGVISLGALAIFTGRSMTILSTGFGAALASRPLRSSLTAVSPGLGVASFAFAIWYGAAA